MQVLACVRAGYILQLKANLQLHLIDNEALVCLIKTVSNKQQGFTAIQRQRNRLSCKHLTFAVSNGRVAASAIIAAPADIDKVGNSPASFLLV